MSLLSINLHSIIFYFQFILLSFIGANIGALYLDNHYALTKIQDQHIRMKVYYSVCYTLITVPLSMVIVNLILKFNAFDEWKKYKLKPLKTLISYRDKPVYVTFALLTIVCVFSVLYSIFIVGTLPIIEAMMGKDALYLAQLRIKVSRGFEGNALIKNLTGINLSIFLSYISFAYFKMNNELKWKVMFIITTICSIIIQTLDISKSPLVIYIIGFLIINVLIKGKIKAKKILGTFIFLGILIMFFYNVLGFNTVITVNDGPIGRLVLGQITPLYYYFMYFPELIGYLGNIFGNENSAARLVMMTYNPGGVQMGTAGVMNTLFIGEAYAHFGVLGIIFSTLIVGAILQLTYILIIRLPKSPVYIGFSAYVILKVQAVITGSFIGFLYNPNIIFITIVVITLIIVSRVLLKYTTKKEVNN